MKRFWLRLAIVVGLSPSLPALAERACPDWATPDAPIWQRYGLGKTELDPAHAPAFTDTAYFWAHGTWLEFPLGYRNPWPSLADWRVITDENKYIEFLSSSDASGYSLGKTSYDVSSMTRSWNQPHFTFWMPSLRYLDRNKGGVPSYRPCEAGRPLPTEDEYLVEFSVVWPFLPNSGNSDGARIFRAQAARLANNQPLAFRQMRRVEHALDGPISGRKDYAIHEDDGDLAVNLMCNAPSFAEKGLNPLCRGDVWQRSSGLILFLTMPSDRGQIGYDQRWRAPVAAAINLVSSWRR